MRLAHGVRHNGGWRDGRQLAAGIYGTIISASVMAASAYGASALHQVAVAVVVTVLIYWMAERYAELLAARVRGELLSMARVRHILLEGWPLVQASYTPVIILIVAGWFGAKVPTAILIALIYSVALLILLGMMAARRAGLSGLGQLVSAATTGGLGLILVILKLALH